MINKQIHPKKQNITWITGSRIFFYEKCTRILSSRRNDSKSRDELLPVMEKKYEVLEYKNRRDRGDGRVTTGDGCKHDISWRGGSLHLIRAELDLAETCDNDADQLQHSTHRVSLYVQGEVMEPSDEGEDPWWCREIPGRMCYRCNQQKRGWIRFIIDVLKSFDSGKRFTLLSYFLHIWLRSCIVFWL